MKLNKKAFTLVELLAVIVVLAIVAAIAMRSITGIIKQSRIDSLASSFNAVVEAAEMACVQEGKIDNTGNYLKENDVSINSASGSEIQLDKVGNFSEVDWSDVVSSPKLKIGDAQLDNSGKITYTCDSN